MADQTEQSEREIFYVADPMCSWCWGFSPTLRTLSEFLGGRADLTFIMGGLRPLTRTAMDDAQKFEIEQHWKSVAERSGQPFDHQFFQRDGFVYDTEPACRAVCVVRSVARPLLLDFFEALQRGFYAQNLDITDAAVLSEIARKQGVDHVAFEEHFADVASAYETAGDFHAARQLGVTGYPSVILRQGKDYAMLTAGYQDWDAVKAPLEQWFSNQPVH